MSLILLSRLAAVQPMDVSAGKAVQTCMCRLNIFTLLSLHSPSFMNRSDRVSPSQGHDKRPVRSKKPVALKKTDSSVLSPSTGGDESDMEMPTLLADQMSRYAAATGDIPLGLPVAALSNPELSPMLTPPAGLPAAPRTTGGDIVADMDAVVLFVGRPLFSPLPISHAP